MIAIYAEKASVGYTIAAAMGGLYLKGKNIPVNEVDKNREQLDSHYKRGNGYITLNYEGEDYKVTWGQGHLCELYDVIDYDNSLKYWSNIKTPFIPKDYKIKLMHGTDWKTRKPTGKPDAFTEKQIAIIKDIFNKSDYIINATDDDREGELIFAYVYEITKCKKPYKRMILNDSTEKGIKKALSNLLPSSKVKNKEEAGRARATADWVVGINMTIALSLKNQDMKIVRAGRVKTPVLNFIVEREKEIRDFVSKPFYYFSSVFTTENGGTYEGRIKEKFEDIEEAKERFEKIKNLPGVITKAEKKIKKTESPQLFNLTSLSMLANNMFKYTAQQTLDTVQKLYESGYISYPRTTSNVLPESMKGDMNDVLDLLSDIPQFKDDISRIEAKDRVQSKRHYDDSHVESHYALVPTANIPDLSDLNDMERNMYTLIAQSLIRSVYPPKIHEATSIVTEVGNEKFNTNGNIMIDPSWEQVTYFNKNKKEDTVLPPVNEGDTVKSAPEFKEGKTQPPKRYTDETLLGAMINAGSKIKDKNLAKFLTSSVDEKMGGIGRPSSRANIIESIVKTFCRREKNEIVPTEESMALMERIKIEELKSPEMTAHWEERLSKIESGEESSDSFMGSIHETLKKWDDEVKKGPGYTKPAFEQILMEEKCPFCGGDIRSNSYGYFCSNVNDKDPSSCTFKFYRSIGKTPRKLDDVDLKDLVLNGNTKVYKFINKEGKEFDAQFVLDKDNKKIDFRFPQKERKELNILCPNCKKPLFEIDNAYVCDTRDFYFSKEIAGNFMSHDVLRTLVEKGETDWIGGFIPKAASKSREPYKAKFVMEDGKAQMKFPERDGSGSGKYSGTKAGAKTGAKTGSKSGTKSRAKGKM